MCGIAGVSLKSGANRKVALLKLKILSLYNQSRGKDATGFYLNGKVDKSILEVDEYFEAKILNETDEESIMMMHARAGSYGYGKTVKQAQPFEIDDNMVITHNGTLKNTTALGLRYNIEELDFESDTEMLGNIIYNHGFDVLNHYKGAAALAFTNKKENDVLYLYHGSSKDLASGPLVSERPLFILETEEGIYYSSLENSLKAIRETIDEIPYSLKHNTVFKIKNGEWEDDIVDIERSEMNVTYIAPVIKNTSRSRMTPTSSKNVFDDLPANDRLVMLETLPLKVLQSKGEEFLYHHQGRYWVNPRKVAQGEYLIKKGGTFGKELEVGTIKRFFWEGVMLNTEGAFKELTRLNTDDADDNWVRHPERYNFAQRISGFAPWPVTNIGAEGFHLDPHFRNSWYQASNRCKTINFTPDYSNGRNYKIVNGYLTAISASQRETTLHNNISDVNMSIMENLKKTSTSVLENLGGGSPEVPFPGVGNLSTGKVKFYDQVFVSLKEASEVIGPKEIAALEDFARKVFKQQWNQPPIEGEVKDYIADLIDLAVKKKLYLLDMILEDGHKQLLKDCYEKQLTPVVDAESSYAPVIMLPEPKDIVIPWTYDATSDGDDFEDVEQREEVEEIFNELIVDLNNMQVSAFNLMDYQDDKLAQDVASQLFDSIDDLANKLGVIAISHGSDNNLEDLQALIDTKIDKNDFK